jgi:hypothetical protein
VGELVGDADGWTDGEVVDPPDEPPEEQALILVSTDLPAHSTEADVVPPRKPTDNTITAAMKPTMTEYSTAVAPRSFRVRFLIRLNMLPSIGAGFGAGTWTPRTNAALGFYVRGSRT